MRKETSLCACGAKKEFRYAAGDAAARAIAGVSKRRGIWE
jgi:hypothetical protein